jgi:hypothetical protein
VDLIEHLNLSPQVIEEVNPYILAMLLAVGTQHSDAADLEPIVH